MLKVASRGYRTETCAAGIMVGGWDGWLGGVRVVSR